MKPNAFATDLAIVDHGQIIAEGSPAELIERLGGHHVIEFSLAGNLHGSVEIWKALPGVDSVHHDDGLVSLNVRVPHHHDSRAARSGGKAVCAVGASDHATSQPGRCFCSPDRQTFAGGITNHDRRSTNASARKLAAARRSSAQRPLVWVSAHFGCAPAGSYGESLKSSSGYSAFPSC